MLAQEKFPLLAVNIFLNIILQLLAHFHCFKPLTELPGNPMQHQIHFDNLKNFLFINNFEIQLGGHQVTDMVWISERVNRGQHLRRQLGQFDQLLKLTANTEHQGFKFFILFIVLHWDFDNLGLQVWLLTGKLNNTELAGTADQNLVIAFLFLGQFMDITHNTDPVQIITGKRIIVRCLFFTAGYQSNHPVAEQGIVNELLGRIAGYLQGKAHTREKNKPVQRQNRQGWRHLQTGRIYAWLLLGWFRFILHIIHQQ